MTMRIVRGIVGIVIVLVGLLWMLQGADLLGGNGGMNGKAIWIVIGAVVFLGGLALLVPLRRWRHE